MRKSPSKVGNKKIKVLIVEDEVFISEQLNVILVELDYNVTSIAYDTPTAIESLNSNPPDLAILDIKMHGENQGFIIAEYIREHMDIPFVFLTSFADETTVKIASEFAPDGYLLKPFNERDIFSTLNVVLKRFEKKDLYFNLKIGHEVHKVKLNDLLWIQSADKYIEIHTTHKRYVKRDGIDSFMGTNNLDDLFRVHRSYAVNLTKIDSVKGQSILIGQIKIPISNSFYEGFLQVFNF